MGGTDAVGTEYDPVVFIKLTDVPQPGMAKFCTGTFIAPRMILTAGHCFPCTASAGDAGLDAGADAGPDAGASDGGGMTPGEGCWNQVTELGSDGPLYYGGSSGIVRQARQGLAWQSPDHTYKLSYVWFPRPASNGQAPDVAVVRTVEAFSGTPATIMGSSGSPAMPDPGNVATTYNGATVDVVGTSEYGFVGGYSAKRRRHAGGAVTAPTGDAGAGVGSTEAFRVTLDSGKFVCMGDSGGPVLFAHGGTLKVGGVVSVGEAGGTMCNVTETFNAAYIPRSFVDELCRDGAWEACPDPNDRDDDGEPDATDNCPNNPNRSQKNHNEADESALHFGTELGDACDPWPDVTVPSGAVALTSVDDSFQTSATGMVISGILFENRVSIAYRPSGYTVTDNYLMRIYDPARNDRQDDLTPKYCACHDYSTSTEASPTIVGDLSCKQTLCPDSGDIPQPNYFYDTGWERLTWEGCPLEDTDRNGRYNECESDLPSRRFVRLFGGTAYCTERNELGCAVNDDARFWSRPGMTGRVLWPWRTQDYPHDPSSTPVYNSNQTVKARVRVWLKPNDPHLPATPASINSAFTEPRTLSWSFAATLAKPLYDAPRVRWTLPAWIDPLAAVSEVRLLAPVRHDTNTEGCPADYNWNFGWAESSSATRALVSSAVTLGSGYLGPAAASLALGDAADQAPQTVGFAAAGSDGLFIFGGAERGGSLSADLWFGGFPQGETGSSVVFEKIGGSQMMALAAGTSPAGASTSVRYSAWKATHVTNTSLPAVSTLVAGASAKWLKGQATSPAGTSDTTSATGGTAVVLSAPCFSQGPPPPQAESVLALSPTWQTLTVFYGDQGSSPDPAAPVALAIYDLQADAWTSGTVDWSQTPGARRHAGYAMVAGDRLVLFGGEAGGAALGGLYSLDLNPETLLAGWPPQRIDDQSAEAPSPRTHAALRFDPLGGPLGRVLLFGGINGAGERQNDLWAFAMDTGTWTLLSDGSGAEAPPPMVAAGIAVLLLDGTPVVYSGTAAGAGQGWAYRFAGQAWERVERSDAPAVAAVSSIGSPAVTGCLAEAASGDLVATTCSGEGDQGFELRPVDGEPGLHEIVRISDGKCLRLDGTLQWRTVGDRQCQYIGWGSPFSLGSCGDDRSRFDLAAWPEDSGYHVRQRFACTDGGQPAGYDVGSCADTNVSADQTLRVSPCVSDVRQRIVAPGWPAHP